MTMRVAIYARGGASAEPTIDGQLGILQHVAEKQGWNIIAAHSDIGQFARRGRDRRPGLDALVRSITAKEIDLVAAYSLCRIGRSVSELLRVLATMRSHDVGLYLHREVGSTVPLASAALFEVAGMLEAYDRGLARERVIASLLRARLAGVRMGRPPLSATKLQRVRVALESGCGIRETARRCAVGVASVHRVRRELVADRDEAVAPVFRTDS